MKTYFVFLCLIISCGLASATTQTTVNQDKPPRLYLKSYSGAHNESGIAAYDNIYGYSIGGGEIQYATNISTDTYTFSENPNYQDGLAGSSSQNAYYLYVGYEPMAGETVNGTATFYWPQSSWPDVSINEIDAITVSSYSGFGNYYSYRTNTGEFSFNINQEHCAMNMSATYSISCAPGPCTGSTTVSRSAQAIMKLQTGGKTISKLRNLFGISGGAAQYQYALIEWDGGGYRKQGWIVTNTIPIPKQNITIGSYGALNASGVLYKSLPDNANIDVTPYVAGVDYYSFNVSAQKYHSYFDLFVQQANPGYSLIFYNPTNDVGHAFWQFRTDAPGDALQYISANLTGYLGKKWGFYPYNGLFTVPGILQNDTNHPANIKRTFYVGFPDLLQGLIYTRGISNAPPVYSLTGFNCVSAARCAGFAADIFGLPGDISPQNFGVTLIEMYPAPGLVIGPFDDETDIFYSSAPY